jgi:nucleoid-associated protein YgaU
MIRRSFVLLIGGLVMLGILAGCATTTEPEPEPGPDVASEQRLKREAQAAIDQAKAKLKEADALGYAWRDTGKLIEQAEEAFAKGEDKDAVQAGDHFREAKRLAEQALVQSEAAIDQYYLEQAKFKIEKLEQVSGLTPEEQQLLDSARGYYNQAKGRAAYDAASRLEAMLAAKRMVYEVMAGDSLWGIAGQGNVYGDPYQWPLIFKANADQMTDADLIYPGQQLEIDRNPSSADVSAAVQHAKTRGAWSLGVVEESDKAFLAR